MHDWLFLTHLNSAITMAGFILKNTLSDNDNIMRGVRKVAEGHIQSQMWRKALRSCLQTAEVMSKFCLFSLRKID